MVSESFFLKRGVFQGAGSTLHRESSDEYFTLNVYKENHAGNCLYNVRVFQGITCTMCEFL
jgi:hypothetical protein